MFLQLAYKEVRIVALSRKLVRKCYETAQEVPDTETATLVHQFKQSVLLTHVSITEGAFETSKKRRRKQLKLAQRSLVVTDAVFEVMYELGFIKDDKADEISSLLFATYKLLKKLIRKG